MVQQLAGALSVISVDGDTRLVGPLFRRKYRVSPTCLIAQQAVNDRLSIDRIRDGLTHLLIGKNRIGQIDPEVRDIRSHRSLDLQTAAAIQCPVGLGIELSVVGQIDFTAHQRRLARTVVGNQRDLDKADGWCAVPIIGVCFQPYPLSFGVGNEAIGSSSNRRVDDVGAGSIGDNADGRKIPDKGIEGLAASKDCGQWIRSFYRDNLVERSTNRRLQIRGEQRVERVLDVRRGERLAVMKLHILSEMKRESLEIGRASCRERGEMWAIRGQLQYIRET